MFFVVQGGAIRKPADSSRSAALARGPAAQGRTVCFSLPTLFGFAVLAFRVGSIMSRLRRWFMVGCNPERYLYCRAHSKNVSKRTP